MLKSVIYMHRFQLNDASKRSPRAAPKAHADLVADAHDHAHAHASPHDNDVGKWGAQRSEPKSETRRVGRLNVSLGHKSNKQLKRARGKIKGKWECEWGGEGERRMGRISMKEMQLGAKEWSRSGSQVGCQKNDYLNKSLLEFSSSTATELSLSPARVVDVVEVDVVAIVVARSQLRSKSLLAVPAWLRSICHVIHFQPGKQHNQQSWL